MNNKIQFYNIISVSLYILQGNLYGDLYTFENSFALYINSPFLQNKLSKLFYSCFVSIEKYTNLSSSASA